MKNEESISPEELASRYIGWLEHSGSGDPSALYLWEKLIREQPEKAWPVFLELVRLRPSDDEILEQVWYRLHALLHQHWDRFHDRCLRLIQSNDRLRRIAPTDELTRDHYREEPFNLVETADSDLANMIHHGRAHRVMELIRKDPDAALPLVFEIINRSPLYGFKSFDVQSPLVDLVRNHGLRVIDRIEEAAGQSVMIRRCLWRMRRDQRLQKILPPQIWERLMRATRGTTDYNSDDPPPLSQPLPPEQEEMLDSWFIYEKTIWSFFTLKSLVKTDPELAWEAISRLIYRAPEEELGYIGAAYLEHLLEFHCDAFIDRVEAVAAENPRFRKTLGSIYRLGQSDQLWERIIRASSRISDNQLDKPPPDKSSLE